MLLFCFILEEIIRLSISLCLTLKMRKVEKWEVGKASAVRRGRKGTSKEHAAGSRTLGSPASPDLHHVDGFLQGCLPWILGLETKEPWEDGCTRSGDAGLAP